MALASPPSIKRDNLSLMNRCLGARGLPEEQLSHWRLGTNALVSGQSYCCREASSLVGCLAFQDASVKLPPPADSGCGLALAGKFPSRKVDYGLNLNFNRFPLLFTHIIRTVLLSLPLFLPARVFFCMCGSCDSVVRSSSSLAQC